MNRVVTTAMTTVLLLLSALNAFGASLEYSPESTYVTVPAGSEQAVPMTVYLVDATSGTYYLWFLSVVDGTLPADWIAPSRTTTFLNRYWNSATTDLTIKVPEDAEPGLYSARIFSQAMKTHFFADPGRGFYLEVNVPSSCNGKPEVFIDSFGPEFLWPPNGSMDGVTVKGTVTVPAGCTLYEVGYSVDDEYGIYTGVGTVSVDGRGEFSLPIPLEASREGQDKDGRHYTVTIYAEDEAGIATSEVLKVLVPHDRRK